MLHVSEDCLDGIEPWSVRRESNCHQSSFVTVFFDFFFCMDSSVVKDEYSLFSYDGSLFLFFAGVFTKMSDDFPFELFKELYERLSSVSLLSNLCEEFAILC